MTNTELQNAGPAAAAPIQTSPAAGGVYAPRVDVVETDDELLLYADLPGVRAEDVSLNCKGNELILHARCFPRRYGREATHAEYGVGDFYRSFAITEQVDHSGIEASLKDGVLAVRVPKAESVRPKRITVRGG
jgi:HSP20 family molecular chaperone IbpA